MVNFNGRIGNVGVPVTGDYNYNNQRAHAINDDASIFDFDKFESTSLNVNNSKQDYDQRSYDRFERSTPQGARADDSIFEDENIFAKHFAATNNITEDEAKFVLEKQYGMTNNIFYA